ncbi:MAG: hypothetical protein DDT26_02771 [Dehalococcoidia bacterium]|nr:hypothetical protein [Chloroflexota bacterium]
MGSRPQDQTSAPFGVSECRISGKLGRIDTVGMVQDGAYPPRDGEPVAIRISQVGGDVTLQHLTLYRL